MDFGGQTVFNKVIIRQFLQRIKNYQIQYYNGFSYSDAYTGLNPAVDQTVTFNAVSSNKIRLNIIDINGTLGPSVYEFEVYNDDTPYKIPQSQMTATATSYEPVDAPVNAIDGNSVTLWHTNGIFPIRCRNQSLWRWAEVTASTKLN